MYFIYFVLMIGFLYSLKTSLPDLLNITNTIWVHISVNFVREQLGDLTCELNPYIVLIINDEFKLWVSQGRKHPLHNNLSPTDPLISSFSNED